MLFLVVFLVSLTSACWQEPEPPPPPPLEFVAEWGVRGNGPGQLSLPLSLTVDFAGNVYVADAGSAFIHKFDPSGTPLLSFTAAGLERPTGIAVDSGGAIYVADYARDSVFIFLPDGKLRRRIRGRPGRRFAGPVGVTLDGEDNLYVVEFDGHRIQKFNSRGRFVRAWGSDGDAPGQFHFPVDAAVGPDHLLYVADTHNRRVQKFSDDGEFLATWGKPGTAPDMMDDVSGIDVARGSVWLADSGNHRVQVWTLDGKHILTHDLRPRLSVGMETPTDLVVTRSGELLVLDPAGPRVLRFRIHF